MSTISVNSLADTVANDGVVTLREAIISANGTPGADTIQFDAALAGGTIVLSGTQLPTITDDVTITGLGADQLAIDAQGTSRILEIALGTSAEVRQLTLIRGNANGGAVLNFGTLLVHGSTLTGNSAEFGGALFNAGTLAVTESIVSGNSATIQGGGIRNSGMLMVIDATINGNSAGGGVSFANRGGGGIFNSFGTVTVRASMVSNNSAVGGSGGAITNSGGMMTLIGSVLNDNSADFSAGGVVNDAAGTLAVTASTLNGNSAGHSAGGILNFSGSSLMVSESTLSGNSAGTQGGAIENAGLVTLTDSLLVANSAVIGGAILNQSNGSLVMSASTLSGNSAFAGGAIGNRSNATLTIHASTLDGNSAEFRGGAIENAGAAAQISDTTLSGNSAAVAGGAIISGGTLILSGSTVTNNRAGGIGGGITSAGGTATLYNTIAAGNLRGLVGNQVPDDVSGTIHPASTHNLIGDANSAGGLVHGVNANIVGDGSGGVIDINTVLDITLADNGGPTLTHALVAGSPAIDAGDNGLIPAGVTTDQRGDGFPRIVNGTVDIGSFEVQDQAGEPQVESIIYFNQDAQAERNFSPEATGQRSIIRRIQVVFDGPVAVPLGPVSDDSFSLRELAGSGNIGLTVLSSQIDSVTRKTTVVLAFDALSPFVEGSGSLRDGNYEFTVNGSQLGVDADADGNSGGSAIDEFFRYFGDSDGDRDVDALDYANYARAIRRIDLAFIGLFDFDGDGDVLHGGVPDQDDLRAFRSRYGRRLSR